MALSFRFAVREDTPLILSFIKALADYERMADQVVADEALLAEQLFDRGGAEVLFALEDGKEVGFALFFHNFSTFLGRAGLYLEDLYVLPEKRGRGYGKAPAKPSTPWRNKPNIVQLFKGRSLDRPLNACHCVSSIPFRSTASAYFICSCFGLPARRSLWVSSSTAANCGPGAKPASIRSRPMRYGSPIRAS